ncbi:MAG: DivIVA domain-containing protein [Bacilli bacterium]|jgi:cell division initiation protein|nr:DivIVA domain-containing protein [Bacilli bacterium]
MKKFRTSFNGYNKQEVNLFVRDVTREYESMLNNLKARDQEIENLKQKLIQYQNMETTLNRALLVAEDASSQIKKLARDESKGIIDDARRNASRIVNEALMRATKLEQDAENLKRRIVVFKRKFRQAMEAEIENIDEMPEDY